MVRMKQREAVDPSACFLDVFDAADTPVILSSTLSRCYPDDSLYLFVGTTAEKETKNFPANVQEH